MLRLIHNLLLNFYICIDSIPAYRQAGAILTTQYPPVPYKEKEIEKLYYTIGEVSEMLGLNASQIRYWETEFGELKPKKDRKGNRLFTKEDIETIRLIHHLVKEKGFTIEGAKSKLKGGTDDAMKKMKLIESLKKLRGFLEELKDQL